MKTTQDAVQKPARWKPGQLQDAIIARLKKRAHTRRELYRVFPGTGRTSIVAALKSSPGVMEQNGLYVFRNSPRPRVDPHAQKAEIHDFKRGQLAEALRDLEPGTIVDDLQLAIASAEVQVKLDALSDPRRASIAFIAGLLRSGLVTPV